MRTSYLFLILLFIVVGCSSESGEIKERPKKPKKQARYNIDSFNHYSTFFYLDRVESNEKELKFTFLDTSTFYQPTRHLQNYMLTMLTAFDVPDATYPSDTVEFYVAMPRRPDGDIVMRYGVKELQKYHRMSSHPSVKSKILALNELNRKYYLMKEEHQILDPLGKLNLYCGSVLAPKSWVGFDVYGLIFEYEYNKKGKFDVTSHVELFDGILTDDLFIKDKEMAKEMHQILIK